MQTVVSPAWWKWAWWLLLGVALVCYLFLWTNTHSIDAWAYAGQVRHGTDLFAPHHLLYTATVHAKAQMLRVTGISIGAMQMALAFNALAAWLCLLRLGGILHRAGAAPLLRLGLLGMAAFSFGFWRFATENEAYIFPIFFSLGASWFWLGWLRSEKTVLALLCSLCGVVAALYHQMHIFWWLGLLTGGFVYGQDRKRWLLAYLSPALLLPLAYLLVLGLYEGQALTMGSLWHYVLRDVYSGAVGQPLGAWHFLLGAANLLRTFFQVHGQVAWLMKHHWAFLTAGAFVLALLVMFLKQVFPAVRRARVGDRAVFRTHMGILLLHFAFALYNVGNAEFMAMLPALLAIGVSACRVSAKPFVVLAAALFVHNLVFGIWPNHRYKWDADVEVAQYVAAQGDVVFVATYPALTENIVYYHTGWFPQNIARPFWYKTKAVPAIFEKTVLTDVGHRPRLMSRAALLQDTSALFYHESVPVASFPTVLGAHTVVRVVPERHPSIGPGTSSCAPRMANWPGTAALPR